MAMPSVGWITLYAMSAATATVGRLATVPSCCAVRGSLDRVEMAMPIQIDKPATSGVKTSWARISGTCRSASATALAASTSTARMTAAYTRYEIASEGMSDASALPSRNSSRRSGVVSTGSSVPCCRSPTTAYAARAAGTRAGMPNMYSSTSAPWSASEAEAGRAKIWINGGMMKTTGRMTIAPTMAPLRRYSRSSFRRTARTRLLLRLMVGSCSPRRSAPGRHPRASDVTH